VYMSRELNRFDIDASAELCQEDLEVTLCNISSYTASLRPARSEPAR
jgi:hypothetical protein